MNKIAHEYAKSDGLMLDMKNLRNSLSNCA